MRSAPLAGRGVLKILAKLAFIPKLIQLFDRREKWQFAGVMVADLFS